jgi:hypothetical protein
VPNPFHTQSWDFTPGTLVLRMSKGTPKHDAAKPLAQDGTTSIFTQVRLSVLHFDNRRCTKQTAGRAFLIAVALRRPPYRACGAL